jgi:RNA polymerase sigma-70 factor (ECF subfamily)
MMALMMEQRIPDAELARNAAGGDRDSFSALVERHYGFIFRLAWRLTGHKADAEDIAQEVCARLGSAILAYRGSGAFTTWLYAMTLNAARDLMRGAAREAARTQAYAVQALIDGDARQAPEDDRAAVLWEAVRCLPDKQRDAVLLVYGEGLAHAAAAEIMAISEKTVSWHIHEAKKRLKVLMRQAGEG